MSIYDCVRLITLGCPVSYFAYVKESGKSFAKKLQRSEKEMIKKKRSLLTDYNKERKKKKERKKERKTL